MVLTPVGCPLGHIDKWIIRRGSLRDLPSVGVKECAICGHVTHNQDASGVVDYAGGTMRNFDWAQGYGELAPAILDRSRRVDELKKLTVSRNKEPVILDVGCGDGSMIREFEKHGFVAYGLDPDSTAGAIDIKSKIVSSFEEIGILPEEAAVPDVITAFHVIEHIYDPVSFLKKLLYTLPSGGQVLIETPNARDALLAKFACTDFESFTYWSHHPHLYSDASLEGILELAGFESVRVSGVQRYGLANHLFWLSEGKPGGHSTWKDLISDETESGYAQDLARLGLSDTLTATALKP